MTIGGVPPLINKPSFINPGLTLCIYIYMSRLLPTSQIRLIKWLNDQFPSLVAIIYIQRIGAIMYTYNLAHPMDDPLTPSRDVPSQWPFCAKVSRIKASVLTTSPVMLISPVHHAHRGRHRKNRVSQALSHVKPSSAQCFRKVPMDLNIYISVIAIQL